MRFRKSGMRKRISSFIILFFFCYLPTIAQVIDNTSSFRNINSDKYFRFHYENDFFSAADYYYSQGASLEFVHEALRKFPISKILFHPAHDALRYGMLIEQDVYTPSSIRHDEILYGDRPYAGVLLFKTFLISIDSINAVRYTSSFSAGVLGSAAGGKETQTAIHRMTGNFIPLGWQHQIKNDIVINYQIGFEKKIFLKKFLLLNGNAEFSAGTLKNKISIGAIAMAGYFDSPFNSTEHKQKFSFHLYDEPSLGAIGYDATMQGGLFNRESDYTISSERLMRLTFQNNFGVVFNIGKIYLEYFQSLITKEFSSGVSHRWGGIRMGIVL